jgi:hypothetical protein
VCSGSKLFGTSINMCLIVLHRWAAMQLVSCAFTPSHSVFLFMLLACCRALQ